MGSMLGHILPGIGFFLVGLWHLFNHIKLYALHPPSYVAPLWFPVPPAPSKLRYSEPFLIIAGSTASIAVELFISPHRHQPLDPDLTIPSNHLHTVEHASISLALLLYGASLVFLDRPHLAVPRGLTHFLASVALAQELILFHLHSTDHTGPEGQYHFFLQLLVLVSLATTLMGIGFPSSFMVSFVRSLSLVFQGVWFVVMGFMLWTPELLPKGCFLHDDDGRKVARCSGEESLHRARSLINLEFCWFLTGISIFGVSYYLFLVKIYGEKAEYFSLPMNELQKEGDQQDDNIELEPQKKSMLGNSID